jgi:hypothetical protein
VYWYFTSLIFNFPRYEIYASKPIKKGDQLFHTYRSLKWRKCFSGINGLLEDKKKEEEEKDENSCTTSCGDEESTEQ